MPSPRISDHEPQAISVDEAVSTKFEILGSDRVSDRNKLFGHTRAHTLGALYHTDGRIINMSTRSGGHNGDHVTSVDPLVLLGQNRTRTFPRIADSSIFLGNFMNHYGHFITESLSRMWYLSHGPRKQLFDHYVYFPFIFDNGRIAISSFHRYFLHLFDIPLDRLRFISDPVVLERVVVPQQLWVVNRFCYQSLRPLYARVRNRHYKCAAFDRVFLSRTSPTFARFKNISEVEKLFAAYGFEILYPEQLGIVQQLNAYANCQIMAGFSGSALHNCLFSKEGTLVIEIGDMRSPHEPLVMQSICNDLAQVAATYIPYVGSDDGMANVGQIEAKLRLILKHGIDDRSVPV